MTKVSKFDLDTGTLFETRRAHLSALIIPFGVYSLSDFQLHLHKPDDTLSGHGALAPTTHLVLLTQCRVIQFNSIFYLTTNCAHECCCSFRQKKPKPYPS